MSGGWKPTKYGDVLTTDEWLEIVSWVNDRFTPGWTVDRAAAFGVDVKAYNAEDVWDAVYRLYDRGLEYPPNGSQLLAETGEVVRQRMQQAKWDAQGLPPPAEREDGTWTTWREMIGYAGLTLDEAIQTRHGQLYPKGCPHDACDVCGNIVR